MKRPRWATNLASTPWRLAGVALVLLALLVLAPVKGGLDASSAEENPGQFYPCTSCHQAMDLTGDRKQVPLHGIDLTTGAHRGLMCSNCHVPPLMQTLINGSEVFIPGFHNQSQVMETNKVCAVCHPHEYVDYERLLHANKTFICPDGQAYKVIGYKGVDYTFHACEEYINLTVVPAKACVECHNPHNPTMMPLNILPEPSNRPEPPEESDVALGGLAALLGSLVLIFPAFMMPKRRERLEVIVDEQ